MRVLVEVARTKVISTAAENLNADPTTVTKHLRTLNALFGPLTVAHRGNAEVTITELGRSVAARFDEILMAQRSLVHQRRTTAVRYLPHHSPTVMPAAAAMIAENYPLELSVLGEHHRAVDHFVDRALRPLVAGLFDVAIGIDPHDFGSSAEVAQSYATVTNQLTTTPLYRAWLEVMVPKGGPHAERRYITVADLANDPLPLLVAPVGTRSRGQLEKLFAQARLTPTVRIAEYESKVLIMAAYSGLGLAVLPSDLALQFDSAWDAPLASTAQADRWAWVPLRARPDEPADTYNVVAHRRRQTTADAGAGLFIAKLQNVVHEVMTASGRLDALAISQEDTQTVTSEPDGSAERAATRGP
ncbi:LysR family transcriptional regulator (plasmid) [Rhodococcus sp. NBC_00294]